MKTSTRNTRTFYGTKRAEARLDLENRITRTLYNAGEMKIRELADRVGVSKSPALRDVIADMTKTGVLSCRWGEYKHTGVILVSLSDETYNALWRADHEVERLEIGA